MQIIEYVYGATLLAYLLVLCYVTVYCLLQLHLLVAYLRVHSEAAPIVHKPRHWPKVTVQLPLYNELYVATRIIDACCSFNYPRSCLQIQVLDDSTDETVDIVAARVAAWQDRGIDIHHVRRQQRTGYKAGALADAMDATTGEFIAIFDADFVPKADFLIRSVPHFQDASVGIVQSRWEHLNEDYSLLTQLQALQLNVHFTVEQTGRRAANLFAQFNGTAGLWRKKCIEDAGSWRALTLTEDLDLSVRAQLRGWTIKYLEDNLAPAELPMEMHAFKSQQHRWMKGGAQCAKILLPQLWQHETLSFWQKVHGTAHLLGSSIFVFVWLIGVLSLPAALAIAHFDLDPSFFTIFLSATLAVGAVYYVGNAQRSWRGLPRSEAVIRFVMLFPVFLSLSMGLSLHNGWAVLQGFFGRKHSEFVRTPKFDLGAAVGTEAKQKLAANVYRGQKLSWIAVGECVLAGVFAAAVVWGFASGNTFFILFHLMLAFGYGTICMLTLRHMKLGKSGIVQQGPINLAAPPLPSKHFLPLEGACVSADA